MPNTKTDKYGSQPNPEKTAQHQQEAAEAMPVKPQSSKTHPTVREKDGIQTVLRPNTEPSQGSGADDSLIQEAQENVKHESPLASSIHYRHCLKCKAFDTLQPGTLNAQA